jgi:hypothetical protein
MTVIAASLTERTVRPRLTLVNTLVPMVRAERTKGLREAAGRRLERYVKERWPRGKGGMRGLASVIGSSPETMYSWFRGDTEPGMAHLRELADKLETTRAILVAVLDGEPADVAEPIEVRLRAVEAELESLRALRAVAGSQVPPVPDGTAG